MQKKINMHKLKSKTIYYMALWKTSMFNLNGPLRLNIVPGNQSITLCYFGVSHRFFS